MLASEIRDMNEAQIAQHLVAEYKQEMFNLRFSVCDAQIEKSRPLPGGAPRCGALADRCCGNARSRRSMRPRSPSYRRW